MVGHDVQTHQEQYQLLYRLRLPQGQVDLVSLPYKFKLFYSAFSTSAPKHKSTIFGSFITRRFYTFCLLLLFNTIRFHHYYIFMLYNYCLITITTVWNISIMAAIWLIIAFTQGFTVAAVETSILIYIMRSNFLAINTELFSHLIYMDYINNNYSPQWRWVVVVDICRTAKQWGKYPRLTTSTSVNNCFSIY